ncbi:hypothetical protein Tco_0543492 [Tanacetum coccineum]
MASFQKIIIVFAICFASAAMLATADEWAPAPAPSHAPNALPSVQSAMLGFTGVALLRCKLVGKGLKVGNSFEIWYDVPNDARLVGV